MLITLDEVIKRVQDLMDDPGGRFFTKEYVLTAVNQVSDEFNVKLQMIGLKYLDVVAVITPFAANTANFNAYQVAGQPLANMMLPKFIEWRLPTDLDINYL